MFTTRGLYIPRAYTLPGHYIPRLVRYQGSYILRFLFFQGMHITKNPIIQILCVPNGYTLLHFQGLTFSQVIHTSGTVESQRLQIFKFPRVHILSLYVPKVFTFPRPYIHITRPLHFQSLELPRMLNSQFFFYI